ncbi:MAG: type II toxin-antitoxin system VapC family toxin [Tepidiformaceae bacterium]
MRVLLDTSSLLYLANDPGAYYSPDLQSFLTDPGTDLDVPIASLWEIAIKYSLGKLTLPLPPSQWAPSRLARHRLGTLGISASHVLGVESLPLHHRDPFDRLIAIQSLLEGIPLLAADRIFDLYGVARIDPRGEDPRSLP